MNLENILLFEQSPEALEVVKSGNAIVSSGGIRRKGEAGTGFLEQAKPAALSVADFQSLFEGKSHALETDDRLSHLEARLELSDAGLKEIQNIGWLNNAAIQRTYTLTHKGFLQSLYGLEFVAQQLSGLELYVKRRDIKELAQETQTYINYLKSDAGDLRSKRYSVTNGKIAEHLDQISALIKRLLSDVENNEGDQSVSVQILTALLPPFAFVVRKYSSLYYYENDGELMPGDYDEWVKMISLASKSKSFNEKIEYYINLKYSIPYRDKVLLYRGFGGEMTKLLANVKFDKKYIESHSKEEYLSLDKQICQKIEANEYYVEGHNVVIFLDSSKQTVAD